MSNNRLYKVKKFIAGSCLCNKYCDKLISLAIYILLLVNIVFTSSASIGVKTNLSTTILQIVKQFVIIASGLALYHLLSNFFDFNKVSKRIILISFIMFVFLVGAFAWCMFFGDVNGNYSWIYFSHFSIQPSEFVKIVVILIVASFLCDKKFSKVKHTFTIIRLPLFLIFIFCLIIALLQKDLGSGFVVFAIGCIVLLVPNHKLLHKLQIVLVVCAVFGVGLCLFLLTKSGQELLINAGLVNVAARFQAVTNPSVYDDRTREIFYSLLGIAKGGISGVGLGNSVQKFGYLVSSDADYIFAIIVEEAGLFGILLVFVPYAILLGRLVYNVRIMKKESEKVILVGTIAYLFIHFFLNIGGVSGLVPLTGIPLLLLSKGGSATWSIMALLGICQKIINDHYLEKQKKVEEILCA